MIVTNHDNKVQDTAPSKISPSDQTSGYNYSTRMSESYTPKPTNLLTSQDQPIHIEQYHGLPMRHPSEPSHVSNTF